MKEDGRKPLRIPRILRFVLIVTVQLVSQLNDVPKLIFPVLYSGHRLYPYKKWRDDRALSRLAAYGGSPVIRVFFPAGRHNDICFRKP